MGKSTKQISSTPLVSVIVPIHNSSKTILESLSSILDQTYSNLEIIVVDDHSTDGSANVVKQLIATDDRIVLKKLNKMQHGAMEARSQAMSMARGKYIAFLDSDDIWKKEKLSRQVAFMEENRIPFSYSDYELIDEEGQALKIVRHAPKRMSYFRMLLGDSVGCLTVIFRRTYLRQIQYVRLEKRNDYAIWCQILKIARYGAKTPGVLAAYRKSRNSLSSGRKAHLIKYHYRLHRSVNGFSPVTAVFFTVSNIVVYFWNIIVMRKRI